MVICAELTTELTDGPPISKEFYKSINYRRDVVTDANNNNFFVSSKDHAAVAVNRMDGSFDANRYSIKSFYRNANILLTGGTGFVGKVLLEKLLRSCDNVHHIYVLLRSKRGLSSEQRYKELIQNPVRMTLGMSITFLHINGLNDSLCVRYLIAFEKIIRNVCRKSFLSLAIYRSQTLV